MVFQTHGKIACHQWFSENMHTFWSLILSIIDKGSCLALSQFSVCNVTYVDWNCWNMFSVILGVTLWDPMERQSEEQRNFRLGVMQAGYRNRDSNMFKGWKKFFKRFFKRVGWLEWWSIAGSIQRDFIGGGAQ